ncbi:hypothetical protein Bca4012_061280 [Brassica carinata]
MASSQFAIFCIILIALFPLHEFVDGQGLIKGCVPTNCDSRDKKRSCSCCYNPSKLKTICFKSKAECTAACKV